ncbi:MAG: HAMP domain-containing sensor histidine kinase [Ruminiclostridium sp.]
MSLRVKLIITYLIVLLVSVIIIVFSGVGLITSAISDAANSMLGEQTPKEAFKSAVDIVVDVRHTEKYQPEMLLQDNLPTQIAKQLNGFDGFVVVENNKQYKTYGVENSDESLYSQIEASTRGSHSPEYGLNYLDQKIIWNSEKYAVLKYDFQDNSGKLSYYFLIRMKSVQTAVGHYYYILIIGLILLTIIIIGPLLWITTKDIVNPLKKLENCAQQISIGNLDFHLQSRSNNEIGRVIDSYEKMRYELKKSIDNQLEMEENRKQLLSNITHDLKTPITSIKGYVQGIRDGVANDPNKLSKYLDVIYTKSSDMDAMIDDLFFFSKLDLRKETFNMDYVDIEDFYLSFIEELQLELDNKGVKLVSECLTTKGLKVFMDSQKIKRVMLNIISNSLKFMDKQHKLFNIVFAEQNECLTVKIKDNGIGIEQKELEKIFDRFYRTDPSRDRNTGGSGLGLSIARQIIEQHNGTIEANSKKEEWTEISFSIPIGR